MEKKGTCTQIIFFDIRGYFEISVFQITRFTLKDNPLFQVVKTTLEFQFLLSLF